MKKQKTALIYNRWLHTLGGGELHCLAYARALQDLGYRVTLLSHKPVTLEQINNKFGILLKGIELKFVEDDSFDYISDLSANYDLLINHSHLDYFFPKAKQNFLVVFFPAQLKVGLYEYSKRAWLVPLLRYLLTYPEPQHNISSSNIISDQATLKFNHPIGKVNLKLHFPQLAASTLEQLKIKIDGGSWQASSLQVDHFKNNVIISHTQTSKFLTISIKLVTSKYSSTVELLSTNTPTVSNWLYRLFLQLFPKWEMRLHGGPTVFSKKTLAAYDRILTASKYNQTWIKNYWQLNSLVHQPPVDQQRFNPKAPKQNRIIHIGRFFVGGHTKKQEILIKAFKNLVNAGLKDWELHLIGTIKEGRAHLKFVNELQKQALNYPIHFHFDATTNKLVSLLNSAKIYWHATGYQENLDSHPEKAEHFGLTTLEAMSAGCVPIVFNQGGQPEIVTPRSGYVWQTLNELIEKTSDLINHPQKLAELKKGALKRAADFRYHQFKQKLNEIINQT